jgi:hypothetical protein
MAEGWQIMESPLAGRNGWGARIRQELPSGDEHFLNGN